MKTLFQLALCTLVLTGTAALPALGQDCSPRGVWRINHSNGAVGVFDTIRVDANGGIFSFGREGRFTGELSGYIEGREVYFSIAWSNNHTGEYEGSISSSGRVTGHNYDAGDRSQQNVFVIRNAFLC